jgi:hypothetical protein
MSTFLYETSPLDPLIYAAVPVVLLAVTTVACLVPAQRAARLDPMAGRRATARDWGQDQGFRTRDSAPGIQD